jgi:hypothetical protein
MIGGAAGLRLARFALSGAFEADLQTGELRNDGVKLRPGVVDV